MRQPDERHGEHRGVGRAHVVEQGTRGAHQTDADHAARHGADQDDGEDALRNLMNDADGAAADPLIRQRLADAWIGLEIQRYNALIAANNLPALLADHHGADPAALDRAYRIAGRLRNATQPHFRDTYGWTRYLKGEYEEALEHLTAAAEVIRADNPLGSFIYTISCMHCMTVSLAQGGDGLGTVWGEELALKMLGDAGFNDVRVETLDHDIINNYYIMTK